MGSSTAAARLITATALALGVAGAAVAGCAPDSVDLRTATGTVRFSVTIADTQPEREKGLMFVKQMGRSSGMLFVYEHPQHANFWMKNTLIPLDMVFADVTGLVTEVHSDAVPQDLTPIDGGPGVAFVLEINGGLAKRLGIAPGAVLRHPGIAQSGAAWPCTSE